MQERVEIEDEERRGTAGFIGAHPGWLSAMLRPEQNQF